MRANIDDRRHALDSELTPALPDARVRAAMAAFYKSSEGYALQQASHTAAYFHRLLGVMDAVLAQPSLSVLEIGAGSATAMQEFLARHPDARAVAMELSAASIQAARHGAGRHCARWRGTLSTFRFEIARSMRSSPSRCWNIFPTWRAPSVKCCVSCAAPDTSSSACRITRRSGRRSKIDCAAGIGVRLA